ncbi:MAG: hypothetical protein BGO55_05760 [Sphingobacteriales bacterium 50-39]|nr:hypothetical protein [Sphingobacteriales bacterium]OJW56097.1 MAG: hypothetical protein BGO55_05760 [Sphingobacteriales bacterium 50-39]
MNQESKLIKSKPGLLNLAEHLGNVSSEHTVGSIASEKRLWKLLTNLARQKMLDRLPPAA